jgi:hypothetical protein
MLLFNGFLHRDRLAGIIARSLVSGYDGPPAVREDSRDLKRLVNYNAYTGCLILDAFAHSFLADLHGEPIRSSVVQTKGALKDFIVQRASCVSPHAQELIDHYRRFPEDYYRETPMNGRIYHRGENDARFAGAARVKRFRRIAEKASRYLIDFLFDRIKSTAEALAAERAARMGIDLNRLNTPLQEQVAEFAHAERRVLKLVRNGQLLETLPTLPMNDILGLKVLCDKAEVDRVTEHLDKLEGCSVGDREVHSGNYTATHLGVRFRWPRDMILAHPPTGRARDILRQRGCARHSEDAFIEFASTAEDEVAIEVILCSCEEMIESEIGRSMHEERIVAQRHNERYQGSLAKNIEYLMEYLFRFCVSPLSALDEVPIRLWGKYMPDYIDQLHQRLSGVSAETDFTQACICGGRDSPGASPDDA